jgi:exopolyphosphatase/guanosine-5'-triphosphate,3'-diphosphate pyrophosphatase
MTRRVAAIDCGTNSIRLLIADLNPPAPPDPERTQASPGQPDPTAPPLADLAREMRIVRLGEGVDRSGRLSEAALDRTIGALREYASLIAEAKPEAIRMVATSATRDAANSREFTDRVLAVLGVAPEVISGDEEARLSFAGATRELAGGAASPPYLVTDIGGGSTEFILGDAAVAAARSVDVGCVRLTERHLHGDPPGRQERADTVADIDRALDQVAVSVPGAAAAATFVGLAGSVTTVAAIALGLDHYDSARIHHARVSASRVREISGELLAMTRAERAAIGAMHPGRVDVIGAGALVLDRVMTRFGFAEVLVSEHDILDGIAWSLVT